MRQEAVEHFQGILDQYEQRYQQLRSEVIYAERVQQITGTLTADAVSKALAETQRLKNGITTQMLSDEKGLETVAAKTARLRDDLLQMTNTVRTFITKRAPERESEGELLRTVQESAVDPMRGVELREVILKLVAENPDFQLEQVMRDLQGLFMENQVIIRIQARR